MPGAVRKFLAAVLLALGISILAYEIHSTQNAGNKDFISYWSAGQLLIHHGNPYDPAAVLDLEKSAGYHESRPLLMRNPPYALFLALPLGLAGAKTGAVVWSLLLVGSIVISIRVIWTIQGKPPDRVHLWGYLFAPVLGCLQLGQTSAFILLGLVMFLRWHKTRPLAAGACLAIMAIKPHIFLPLGLVLLVWMAATRSYKLVAGMLVALGAMTALPLGLDHAIWSHYLPVLKGAGAESRMIPTISALFRLLINPQAEWPQYILAILGCLWALTYFLRHRKDWDWNQHGLLLLPVSVLVAPYSWFTDEIVVMPAILRGIFLVEASGRSLVPFALINSIPLAAMLFTVPVASGFYIWTSAAWLVWYIWAASNRNLHETKGETGTDVTAGIA